MRSQEIQSSFKNHLGRPIYTQIESDEVYNSQILPIVDSLSRTSHLSMKKRPVNKSTSILRTQKGSTEISHDENKSYLKIGLQQTQNLFKKSTTILENITAQPQELNQNEQIKASTQSKTLCMIQADKEHVFDGFFMKKKQIPFIKEIFQLFLKEIQRIQVNLLGEYDNPVDVQLNFLSESVNRLRKIQICIQELIIHKNNRSFIDQTIAKVNSDSGIIRNLGVQIFSVYTSAKIAKVYRNPIQAILIYKQVKRLADCAEFFDYKMKSYKNLGKLYMTLKPQLSLLYLTKYLMSSWKLDDKMSELTAYDLLGKYFFYIGDIQRALKFHNKMTLGQNEPENSTLKRLGINRIINGSFQTAKKDNKLTLLEEPEYHVSSDDEVFDVVFQQEYTSKDQENQKSFEPLINNFGVLEKKKQKFNIRTLPRFDKNDEHNQIREIKAANDNIRQKINQFNTDIFNGNEIDLKKLNLSKSRTNIGNFKDKILVQHLSPNRSLGVYQSLEMTKYNRNSVQPSDLNPFIDKTDILKLKKIIKNYVLTSGYIMKWLDEEIAKIRKQFQKPAAPTMGRRKHQALIHF